MLHGYPGCNPKTRHNVELVISFVVVRDTVPGAIAAGPSYIRVASAVIVKVSLVGVAVCRPADGIVIVVNPLASGVVSLAGVAIISPVVSSSASGVVSTVGVAVTRLVVSSPARGVVSSVGVSVIRPVVSSPASGIISLVGAAKRRPVVSGEASGPVPAVVGSTATTRVVQLTVNQPASSVLNRLLAWAVLVVVLVAVLLKST